MPKLKAKDLKQIKKKALKSSALEATDKKVRITVHMGTCGIPSGADKVYKTLKEELDHSGRDDITIVTSGCAVSATKNR